MRYTTLLFDLDGTLYTNNNGLWDAIRGRMSEYMDVKLHIPVETIPALRKHYFETYGTTLRGLQRHYNVDADDYLNFVHDLPLEQYLQPEEKLKKLLKSLPQKKYIFTNADINHASRVLGILGIADYMEDIIDVKALDFNCKPEIEAYQRALIIASVKNVKQCVYFDDIPVNLDPAQKMGIYTVLVGGLDPNESADKSILKLIDLPIEFPELWS
jgi:putative hydrolase of the HAD superfamily